VYWQVAPYDFIPPSLVYFDLVSVELTSYVLGDHGTYTYRFQIPDGVEVLMSAGSTLVASFPSQYGNVVDTEYSSTCSLYRVGPGGLLDSTQTILFLE